MTQLIKGIPAKEYHRQYYLAHKDLIDKTVIKQAKQNREAEKRLAHRELHRKLGTLRKTQTARQK